VKKNGRVRLSLGPVGTVSRTETPTAKRDLIGTVPGVKTGTVLVRGRRGERGGKELRLAFWEEAVDEKRKVPSKKEGYREGEGGGGGRARMTSTCRNRGK